VANEPWSRAVAETSQKSVLQKLLLKSGYRAAVLGAPDSYRAVLADLPPGVELHAALDGTFDFVQVFVTQRAYVLRDGPRWHAALKPSGLFWACYPKGKSVPTDLNRDKLREALYEVKLEAVSQVAIDEVWSALRAKRL
jgi:hypothetical protein